MKRAANIVLVPESVTTMASSAMPSERARAMVCGFSGFPGMLASLSCCLSQARLRDWIWARNS
jgi:hypothetical protein